MIDVAVLGATGLVGQNFVQILAGNPWFRIKSLAASERSKGLKYSKVVKWKLSKRIPEEVSDLEVLSPTPKEIGNVEAVFSALPADIAYGVEEEFAKAGYIVLSNASSHRMDKYVPILNPEVNGEHVGLIDLQRKERKWDGAIVTNPNCTAAVLTLSLKPIYDGFGIKSVIVSTMQALSGAGYPGVASLDIVDNVIPFIEKEEEKVQVETLKMMGSIERYAEFKISASCHRVQTTDGHMEAVFVETRDRADPEKIMETMENFKAEPQFLRLPTAPEKPIVVRKENDRPQPKLDRMEGNGMSVVVGRIRKDPVFDGIKYIVLGHNLIRGAAGCSVLNAEYLKAKGYL
ncbi:MAG: aspartate-semialdehyde dehydrogenase [Candidatus Bathyarchaeia archaeon]